MESDTKLVEDAAAGVFDTQLDPATIEKMQALKTTDEVLEVRYTPTIQDWTDFNVWHWEHSPSGRKRKFFMTYAPPGLWMLTGLLMSAHSWTPLVIFLAFSLVWLAVAGPYWRWRIVRSARRLLSEGPNPGLGKPRSLRISREGLVSESDEGDTRLKWSGIGKIATSDRYIYLYVSAVSAAIIPRSAFQSPDACEHFVETARRYREQAAGLSLDI